MSGRHPERPMIESPVRFEDRTVSLDAVRSSHHDQTIATFVDPEE
jgi:hypothetical protein